MRNSKGQFVKGTHWRPHRPHWDKEWLAREYTEKKRSSADIADECGITDGGIFYWLDKHGIPRRTVSEARAAKRWSSPREANGMFGKVGTASPSWKGGLTPLRQSVYSSIPWADAVRAVWERDGGVCTEPACGYSSTNRRKMHIHHDKDFSRYPALRCDPNNLRLVCSKCHGRIHAEMRKAGEGNGG